MPRTLVRSGAGMRLRCLRRGISSLTETAKESSLTSSALAVTGASALARAKQHVARDYLYELPADRIAQQPLQQRDASKLLCGSISGDGLLSIDHRHFRDLPELLPRGALIVVNDSKVIPARLRARKITGGAAEVLLLRPSGGVLAADALAASNTRGKVGVGTLLHCINEASYSSDALRLRVVRQVGALSALDASGVPPSSSGGGGASFEVEIDAWNADALGNSFGEVLDRLGAVPLPPYLHRKEVATDKSNYQTVYARHEGSVAAPTAGLHITEDVLRRFAQRDIELARLTLHVGAGTFAPLRGESVAEHNMHEEFIDADAGVIRDVADAVRRRRPIVAIGTTSVRALESIYWFGVRQMCGSSGGAAGMLAGQWEPYEVTDAFQEQGRSLPKAADALEAARGAALPGSGRLIGNTSLLIVPGYNFNIINMLVTNFHQPESTLLMLVAAFLGDKRRLWQLYTAAMSNDYRFLSYGDSSLLTSSPPSTTDVNRHA